MGHRKYMRQWLDIASLHSVTEEGLKVVVDGSDGDEHDLWLQTITKDHQPEHL